MLSHDNSVKERLVTGAMWTTAGIIALFFLALLSDLIWHGWSLLSFQFLLSAPENAGRGGGIFPMIVSTILIVGVCLTVTLPIGLGTAVFLSEYLGADHFSSQVIPRSLDILAGVPSIVFGLFGNALFCQTLGLGFSILSGGLTLACMVLPIFIRTTEESFRAISQEQRLTAAALGLSKPKIIWTVLLPAALPGVLVGIILGLGRALAETAALVFTSGYVDRMPESLLDSGRALSVHIYDLAMNVAGGNSHAYATALFLVCALFTINALATWTANRWSTPNELLG